MIGKAIGSKISKYLPIIENKLGFDMFEKKLVMIYYVKYYNKIIN